MISRKPGKNEKEKEHIKKSGLGTSVFMMEMIVVVFFFSLCAAVCILLFVKADNMSRLAADTNQAVTRAESIAEIFKADELENYKNYPETAKGADRNGDSYHFAWNSLWESEQAFQTEERSRTADFYGDVTVSREDEENGTMETATIQMIRSRDRKVLYELTVSSYIGSEAGGRR
ncbi:hypothetical protein [Clostridium sp. AM58-1XD]|uniref:hypothetical protein n=1 Tax=Clostridium sp. AM58-1XD TaxID=2292307 RepID=UPI000E4E879F|nr:hypothetical protein [Clostridium sp. AM58-1XD]RGY98406.1 hypothetical protein DXA13_11430 [Clostridium sp. AM58-1XD]